MQTISSVMKPMTDIPDPLNEIAKEKFNIQYIFPYQRLVISNILKTAGTEGFVQDQSNHDDISPHQIILLPTGAGKSLCFMLPTLLLKGITLVIFPLLSLMSDQQRRTDEADIESVILRGGQTGQQRNEIFNKCRSGSIKMILTNPETALSDSILQELQTCNIEHLVIDETHIVSEWGESFRPAYLEINQLIKKLNIDLVTAFTATASPYILNNIKRIIFPDSTPNIIYANPDRPNVSYHVIKTLSPQQTLIGQIHKSEKPLIVFSSSRTGTELTARMLRQNLHSEDIYFYHAGLTKEEKADVESWFFHSDIGILVATCAYGLGVDKSNIRTVIHIDLPSTVESYLQESGRGGRDRNAAKAILIYSPIETDRLDKILDPLSKSRFQKMINYAKNEIECRRETLLAMLDSEPEICSGCDVCEENIYKPELEAEILSILYLNKRRFTLKNAVYFFKGFKSREIAERQFYRIRGFGLLHDWNTDFIRETLDLLLREKMICISKNLLWKGLLTDSSNMYSSIKCFFSRFHNRFRK